MTTLTSTGFDRLRQRVQAAVFARLPEHVARLGWSAEQIIRHQRTRLRSLLTYAVKHSDFHARRLAGIEPATVELSDLASLPVMTKTEMMSDFDAVLTDRRLTSSLVRQTLAITGAEPRPLFNEYLCMASGGSSGRRGAFVSDVAALAEFTCSLMRPAMARMTAAGGPPSGRRTIAIVGAASPIHGTGCIPQILAGSPVNFIPVPANLPLGELVDRLNRLQAPLLYGYPSMLALLAREQRAGRLAISPVSITANSETLLPAHRAALADAFNAPLLNVFGSSEGLFGSSGPDETTLTFASDMCIIELVDDYDRPVPAGTPSAKVLVTNLYNRIQPLIRYELTDSFIRQPDAANHGHLRATVAGRASELLHYATVDIHPAVVSAVLIRIPEIIDYQVQQTADGIDLTILVDGPLDLRRLRDHLRTALAGAGLPDPQVTISIAATLRRHEQTGKLRRFIPAA